MFSETSHIKALRKQLQTVQSFGHHPNRVFDDWTTLMVAAFLRDEETYMGTMKRYDNTRTIDGLRPADCFANALGALILHMQATDEETLGWLYMEMAANPHAGQFFTPSEVCEVMAGMMVPDKPARILDPACGAGGQLVATAKNMSQASANGSFFAGVDIDPGCCRIAALNLLFFNLDGVIIHGDSLRVHAWDGYATKRSLAFGGSMRRLPQEEAQAFIVGPVKESLDQPAKTQASPVIVLKEAGQGSLLGVAAA